MQPFTAEDNKILDPSLLSSKMQVKVEGGIPVLSTGRDPLKQQGTDFALIARFEAQCLHTTEADSLDSLEIIDRVIHQVDFGFKRRERRYLESIFGQHSVKSDDIKYIPIENLPHALFALRIPTTDPKSLYLE